MSEQETIGIAKRAKTAFLELQNSSTQQKNEALYAIKRILDLKRDQVYDANRQDKRKSLEDLKEKKITEATFKRLDIEGVEQSKYQSLLQGIDDVISLEDPVGNVTMATQLDDGLELYRVTCPLGVICIIFEARPEVVVQISCLTIKSGNAVILKGGSEAHCSNEILVSLIREALRESHLPVDAVQLVSSREQIKTLLNMHHDIDLLIPRGSKSMIQYIQSNTKIPVLGHSEGLCSIYVDDEAHLDKALRIIVDSKTNYPAACNACETILVHQQVSHAFLPLLAKACLQHHIIVHADASALRFFDNGILATEQDFHMEFSDMEMAVKIVASRREAIDHINSHGSHHTDCIVTENREHAKEFMSCVDSASVYCNCSTRFADGFRYGFGAEIGISTNKTHARGPVGLEGLVIYKYWMFGEGHIVSEFGHLKGQRSYQHRPLEKSKFPYEKEAQK